MPMDSPGWHFQRLRLILRVPVTPANWASCKPWLAKAGALYERDSRNPNLEIPNQSEIPASKSSRASMFELVDAL
jgi:hypothetical protein